MFQHITTTTISQAKNLNTSYPPPMKSEGGELRLYPLRTVTIGLLNDGRWREEANADLCRICHPQSHTELDSANTAALAGEQASVAARSGMALRSVARRFANCSPAVALAITFAVADAPRATSEAVARALLTSVARPYPGYAQYQYG